MIEIYTRKENSTKRKISPFKNSNPFESIKSPFTKKDAYERLPVKIGELYNIITENSDELADENGDEIVWNK